VERGRGRKRGGENLSPTIKEINAYAHQSSSATATAAVSYPASY